MNKNNFLWLWILIFSIEIHASHHRSSFSLESLEHKSNHEDIEEIGYEDFKDVEQREKEVYELAIYQGNKKSSEQISQLSYVGNVCAVTTLANPFLFGTTGGIVPLVTKGIGSLAGILSLKISYQNDMKKQRIQDEINAAKQARDLLYALHVCEQDLENPCDL